MSRRHQASRRRTYGRRQHELHERPEPRLAGRGAGPDETGEGIEQVGFLPPRDRPGSVHHWLAD